MRGTSVSKGRGTSGALAFRLRPLAAAMSGLLAAGGVCAQQAADATGGEVAKVVVTSTGIRHSIESSVAAKKNSDSIVEVISAEDIGKLPDVSIAESLARMPGLAGQRVDGRTQTIAIRGMSEHFASTLLNGREQVSTGDNRGAEYDQYPSELINSATIYKTPDGTLIGQGLSGTVDMRTIRPLDYRERAIVLNARGEHNSNGKLVDGTQSNGNRVSASYVDQFANNTIGVAVGFAHLDSPMQEKHYQTWWWDELASAQWRNEAAWNSRGNAVGAGHYEAGGSETWARSREQKRDGLMAVLEYKPNKNLHSTIDAYYSTFAQDERLSKFMFDNTNAWSDPVYTSPPTLMPFNGVSILGSGSIAGVRPILETQHNTRDDDMYALGWNTEAKVADKWTVIADLSYSKANRDEHSLQAYARTAATDTLNYRLSGSSDFPTLKLGFNYADPAVVRLEETWGRAGLAQNTHIDDEIKAFKLQVRRDLDGIFSSADVGVNYSTRDKSRTFNEGQYHLTSGNPTNLGSDVLLAPTDMSFVGIPSVLYFDLGKALGSYATFTANNNFDVWKRNYSVSEKVTTLFGKLNIDTELMAVPLRGNVGVQWVHTDQSAWGYAVENNSDPNAITRGTTYNDALPSLNLVADFGRGLISRFGLAKTMARPRIDDMKVSSSYGLSVTQGGFPVWRGEGGNPELKPWRATAVDLTLEKYFGKASYVALAGFHKHLDTYIYGQELPWDFTGYPNSTTLVPVSNIGTMKRPANGEGGRIQGVELSMALEGALLHPVLDGFGTLLSYSDTASSIQPNGPGTSEPLPGLSGKVRNLTFYYEKAGYSARVSARHRDGFTGEVTGLFTDRKYDVILPETQVDMQLGYAFEHGPYKGLSLLLQVNNLTNEPYRTSQKSGDIVLPKDYNTYGRQILFGLSYKM